MVFFGYPIALTADACLDTHCHCHHPLTHRHCHTTAATAATAAATTERKDALLADIVRECCGELELAREARQPMQILAPEATAALLELGDTSACFVDLGSGQSVVYLLSLAADGSLDYQQVTVIRDGFGRWVCACGFGEVVG